jgi:4-hydroxybenzoate polyprenyltransferase
MREILELMRLNQWAVALFFFIAGMIFSGLAVRSYLDGYRWQMVAWLILGVFYFVWAAAIYDQ